MYIIYADGIGTGGKHFDNEHSILYEVVARLLEHKPRFTHAKLNWPASMASVGGSYSWTEASIMGMEELDKIVDNNPERSFVLLGYSGGCKVIHDWLDANTHRLHKIAAVGLMSDPFRPKLKKQYGMSDTDGWGVCGQRPGPIPDRTFWTTAPGDVISDALSDAILRTPGDASDVMPGRFLWDLREHRRKGNLQLAWQIGIIKKDPIGWFRALGPRLDQARKDIHGYLHGRHTDAYVLPYDGGLSPAYRLADSINWHLDHS